MNYAKKLKKEIEKRWGEIKLVHDILKSRKDIVSVQPKDDPGGRSLLLEEDKNKIKK